MHNQQDTSGVGYFWFVPVKSTCMHNETLKIKDDSSTSAATFVFAHIKRTGRCGQLMPRIQTFLLKDDGNHVWVVVSNGHV